ncbi:hypothetical protein CSUI_001410 [Cystoisospora suis]|uniref:Uncharacterized protein n=1 Tax=Cystoisospora suis TaxID=483139 RepID=A0A2C6LD27_9APIC|nr:hypothetical protein CSUI_001410 [Cystoisospora suis]
MGSGRTAAVGGLLVFFRRIESKIFSNGHSSVVSQEDIRRRCQALVVTLKCARRWSESCCTMYSRLVLKAWPGRYPSHSLMTGAVPYQRLHVMWAIHSSETFELQGSVGLGFTRRCRGRGQGTSLSDLISFWRTGSKMRGGDRGSIVTWKGEWRGRKRRRRVSSVGVPRLRGMCCNACPALIMESCLSG